MLADAANTELRHEIAGATVSDALAALFANEPGLKNHILDERGEIRPHVSIFVDGHRARLETEVRDDSELRVLNAVSGG